jgi:hypothetical protein
MFSRITVNILVNTTYPRLEESFPLIQRVRIICADAFLKTSHIIRQVLS